MRILRPILFVLFLSWFAFAMGCSRSRRNDPAPAPAPTPVVSLCADVNANNIGIALPCECPSNFRLSSDGSSCIALDPEVNSVVISAGATSVNKGGQVNLAVEARDANGNLITSDLQVVWVLDPSFIGSVADNVFYASAQGTATVQASIQGILSNAIDITVNNTAVVNVAAAIEISPAVGNTQASYQMSVADGRQFKAQVFNSSHQALSQMVNWSSDNNAVASVSVTGVITAHAAGEAHVRAYIGSVEDVITITVVDPLVTAVVEGDAALMLELYTWSQAGRHRISLGGVLYRLGLDASQDFTVEYESSDTNIVTVNEEGLVQVNPLLNSSGQARVVATVNLPGIGLVSIAYVANVYNEPRDIDEVIIPIRQEVVAVGEMAMAAKAYAIDRLYRVLTNTSFTWTSSNEAVATVDNEGRVTGVAEGSATITATVNGREFEAHYDVQVTTPIP